MEETLDKQDEIGEANQVPERVKTLTIFTFIGSGLWFLFLVAFMASIDMILEEIPQKDLARIQEEINLDDLRLYIRVAFAFFALLCVLCFIGALLMRKMKKVGFVLYAIGSGLFGLLMLLGLNPIGIITGLTSIIFIVLYARDLKLMK